MVDLLQTGVTWLNTRRASFMAQTVSYIRGVNSVSVPATLASTRYEVADESGILVETVGTDFIVAAADLVITGSRITPEIGDRIWVTRGSETLKFEVLDLGGAGHYRPLDPHGVMLRIHAKHVETVIV